VAGRGEVGVGVDEDCEPTIFCRFVSASCCEVAVLFRENESFNSVFACASLVMCCVILPVKGVCGLLLRGY